MERQSGSRFAGACRSGCDHCFLPAHRNPCVRVKMLAQLFERRASRERSFDVEYTKLGTTGLDISRLCLGCMTFGDPEAGAHPWTLGEDDSRPIIRRAVEVGTAR